MPAFLPRSQETINQNDIDHQLLIALINDMSEAMIALNEQGQIIMSNSVALSLLDTNSLNTKRLDDALKLVDKKGQTVSLQALLLNSQRPLISSDWRLRFIDGSLMNLFISASPVRLGFGARGHGGYVIVFRDITREKSIEEERSDFISVASHELRTPVAIVEGNIGNAMVLAARAGVPDSVKQALAAAHDQTLFLGSLINDLAMLSRAERGRLALSIEAFDAAQLIDSLVHDYKPQAERKKLNLIKNSGRDVGQLLSSELYVREMLQNFITNAIKYTEKGSISLTAAKKPGGIEFEVTDTGIGIPQSEQSRLFTKFYRSDDSRVRQINGTGLGLYVTGKLAKLLGATIQMRSQLNRGTTFRLFVPDFKKDSLGVSP